MRDDAVPGSATAGPPFGVLLDVLLLEPPHAAKLEAMPTRTKEETRRIPGPCSKHRISEPGVAVLSLSITL
jgi:hypothetical protein